MTGEAMNKFSNSFSGRNMHRRIGPMGIVLLAMSLFVSACSTDAADEKSEEFPTLNSVPKSPDKTELAENAGEIQEGLRADRENARYTDEVLRADTSVQAPLPVPSAVTVEEVKEEVVVVKEAEKIVTETVTTVTETTEPESPKVVAEQATEAPAKAAVPPVATTVVSSQGVEQVFEEKLAASSASTTTISENTQFNGPAAAPTASASPSQASSASEGAKEGGRLIQNYAASDGTEPVEIIFFTRGSKRVGNNDKKKLRRIIRAQQQTGGKLKVVGHASSRTRDLPLGEHMLVNLNVSQQRAAAVAQALIDLGASGEDIIIESVSDAVPLSQEAMPRSEAKNRRAEIFLLN